MQGVNEGMRPAPAASCVFIWLRLGAFPQTNSKNESERAPTLTFYNVLVCVCVASKMLSCALLFQRVRVWYLSSLHIHKMFWYRDMQQQRSQHFPRTLNTKKPALAKRCSWGKIFSLGSREGGFYSGAETFRSREMIIFFYSKKARRKIYAHLYIYLLNLLRIFLQRASMLLCTTHHFLQPANLKWWEIHWLAKKYSYT